MEVIFVQSLLLRDLSILSELRACAIYTIQKYCKVFKNALNFNWPTKLTSCKSL